jgi:hypothetical protein
MTIRTASVQGGAVVCGVGGGPQQVRVRIHALARRQGLAYHDAGQRTSCSSRPSIQGPAKAGREGMVSFP